MLRFDDCLCGTSTTGTGTLALAATPNAIGGIDPDVWARATGIGFGNSAALLVDYTLTEYTDSTFATEKSKEGGTGTLTLGSSSGIANATLARTTIDWIATSLNSQPATVNVKPGTGITIGTAANTLVSIEPRSQSVRGWHPYIDTGGADANWGVWPDGMENCASIGANMGFAGGAVRDWYVPFRWSVPMLVKRCTFRIATFTTVVGSPVVDVRIYDTASDGRPGKLLYDFYAANGNTHIAISATGNVNTGAAGNGIFLAPGDYWMDFCTSGLTSGNVSMAGSSAAYYGNTAASARLGATAGTTYSSAIATGASGAAPDPANLTTYTREATVSINGMVFGLSPS